jgi:hypothetical protein
MVIELGGSVFEITHDLVGDLFRAKNTGVTSLGVNLGMFGSAKLCRIPSRLRRGRAPRGAGCDAGELGPVATVLTRGSSTGRDVDGSVRRRREEVSVRETDPCGGGMEELLQPWSRSSLLHRQEKGSEGGK